MQHRRKVVIVLGMHRSGTSAITRGLLALNVDLGENLTPAVAGNNDKGFWEDREVVAINDQLLEQLDASWDSLALIDPSLAPDLQDRAVQYLEEHFRRSPLLGLKDPRISRLLPFWQIVLQRVEAEVAYVICVRHPLSVAQSLAARDDFSLAKSLGLWHQHSLESLLQTGNTTRTVLSFENLMSDPEGQLMRLARQLDLQPAGREQLDEYLHDFLSDHLQHSHHLPDDPELARRAPRDLIELYQLLVELAADRRTLDDIDTQQRIEALQASLDAQRDSLALLESHDRYAKSRIDDLSGKLTEQVESLRYLVNELGTAQRRVKSLEAELEERQRELEESQQELRGKHATIQEIQSSTSWMLTKPVRFTSRLFSGKHREALISLRNYGVQLGRRAYWRLPQGYRAPMLRLVYRHMGFAFRGVPHYEQWRNLGRQSLGAGLSAPELVELRNVPPCDTPDGRIAVHLHLFYSDLAEEFAGHLRNMPFAYDLFVSVCDVQSGDVAQRVFAQLPQCGALYVEQVENRGRDIAPFFCTFGSKLREYTYLLHIHSKKSLYNNGATQGWREYICGALLGGQEQVRSIFTLLGSQGCGVVYPQNFDGLPYMANTWLANSSRGRTWAQRLGLTEQMIPSGYFHYPAGSMFWARSEALAPLFDANLQLDDFEVEAGQRDGTLAHCLERLLTLSSQAQELPIAILRDPQEHAWSPWGFHHYLARNHESLRCSIAAPEIKAVAFDIFDTLLVRPLVNAETTKRLIAQQAGATLGSIYLDYRATAEGRARERTGRDVGLDDIYAELQRLTGLNNDEVSHLRELEERIELASVSVRPEGQALLQQSLALGKPVLLISDMFLPRTCIERMLHDNGIHRWTDFYLSNEVGVRKDQGELYEHVLRDRQLQPNELLMIGDNERSDFQIPDNLGIRTLHLLRATELARGLPKFRPLLEDVQRHDTLDHELAVGLLLRRNFAPITYAEVNVRALTQDSPALLGYNVLGPILAGFIDWLRHSAERDGITQLHFLSREGKLLKAAYDLWCQGLEHSPAAHYLVLSRRAVTMARLASLEDIQRLARPTYFSNSLENFLESRFGYVLTAQRRQQLVDAGHWRSDQLAEVIDGDIRALRPVLEALQAELLEQAAGERPAMMTYLQQKGLHDAAEDSVAVVDVGYSGTIQAQLTGLVERPIHGYYLITDQDIGQVLEPLGAQAHGCFLDRGSRLQPGAELYRQSFQLEKLLSADETQLVRYVLDENGQAVGRFLPQTEAEAAACSTRQAIQQGALDYVRDARNLREHLHPGLRPPRELAQRIWALFIDQPSPVEDELLQRLTLDDHYCGRGYVS
ncbi:rhamnan synthesis F family protein [Pseudomonas denitrificans (nom. rej.)]|nr:rhamnan synthesis F family protein [Pseudomonas denitrificans (nom. rej.)]